MRYTLMNKRKPVFSFDTFRDSFQIDRIDLVHNAEYAPPAIVIEDEVVNTESFSKWITSRNVPASRQHLQESLSVLNVSVGRDMNIDELARRNYFLSLSDQYWIKPSNSDITWDSINFFTNPFSSDVGRMMFDRIQVYTPNLYSPDAAAGGYLSKKWVCDGDKRFLIKASSPPYQQEAFNEEIASKICARLGIPHTEYFAYTKNGESHCRCECFINEDTELVPASAILYKYYFNDNRISKYDLFKNTCKLLHIPYYEQHIDDLLVVDFIMGNEDRHFTNFGAIRDVNTCQYLGFAPIFDTGRSLRFSEDTNYIDINSDIKCTVPFAEYHNQQIEYVSCPDRYDLSKLKGLSDEVAEMFTKSDYKYKDRVKVIASLIDNRIQMLDAALCNKIYTGIDLTTEQNQGRK